MERTRLFLGFVLSCFFLCCLCYLPELEQKWQEYPEDISVWDKLRNVLPFQSPVLEKQQGCSCYFWEGIANMIPTSFLKKRQSFSEKLFQRFLNLLPFSKKHQSFSERVFQRFLNLLPFSKKPQSFSERLFERLLNLLPSSKNPVREELKGFLWSSWAQVANMLPTSYRKKLQSFSERLFDGLLNLLPSSKNPVLEEPKGFLWSSWARVANMLPTSYRKSPNEVTATPNERNWKHFRNGQCITGIFILLLALISRILEPTFKIWSWVLLRKIGEGVFGIVEKAKNIFSGEEIQDWVLLKKIGEGGFGRVYRAKNIISGEEAALKFVIKKEYQQELQREARIMERLHHPNILKMLYPAEMKGNAVLCVEFVDGCSLFDILLKYKRLSEIQAWHVMVQLFSAVEYMHGQNIIHLDIKPGNVLYSRHHEVKLIDFGLAMTFTPGQKVSAFCGTLAYMAPEVVCELEEYEGPNADIWSLGITLKQLLKGLKKVPENTNICSDDCESLLKGMICIDPARRLTIKEIMTHAWVKQPPCPTLESQSLEAPSWQLSLPLLSRSQRRSLLSHSWGRPVRRSYSSLE